jgi:hypothetical protein
VEWRGEGGCGVDGKGGGGGEMTQALYAHMDNKRKKNKINEEELQQGEAKKEN